MDEACDDCSAETNPWRRYVDRKMTYLQNHCKVTESLLWALVGVELLSHHEKQDVEVKKTDLKKMDCLIGIIRYKGPDSYQRFCDALDKAGQDFVVNELTGRPPYGRWSGNSPTVGRGCTRQQYSQGILCTCVHNLVQTQHISVGKYTLIKLLKYPLESLICFNEALEAQNY